MIQATLETDKGPIGIIGINFENWRRLKAGMPVDINLKEMTPPGKRIIRVIVHYAHTYEDVVKDIAEGGLEIPESMLKEARDMDFIIARDRRSARQKHGF